MKNDWQCRFKNPPKEITVGQKLILLCEGEEKTAFKNPIHIDFLDKSQNYSLYVLRTLNQEEHFIALEVTSYRTGEFKNPFIITDGEQKILIEDFSFSVQSVLGAKTGSAQAQGPFGPFTPPFHFWHLTAVIFSVLCLGICSLLFLNRLFKRKKYIQKILDRKNYLQASKSFIINLRKKDIDSGDYPKILERLFRVFLEDCFFIPAVNQTNKQIMKSLKKYQHLVYKKEGQNILQVLNELTDLNKKNELNQKIADRRNILKIKKICQKMVFLLDSEGKSNDMA